MSRWIGRWTILPIAAAVAADEEGDDEEAAMSARDHIRGFTGELEPWPGLRGSIPGPPVVLDGDAILGGDSLPSSRSLQSSLSVPSSANRN